MGNSPDVQIITCPACDGSGQYGGNGGFIDSVILQKPGCPACMGKKRLALTSR
jgi:DnaJ-class molecular chaperone